MPGICGSIDLRPDACLPSLASMTGPLRPHAWFTTETCEAFDGATFGAVSLKRRGWQSRVAVSRDGEWACVLDGELYNAAEARSALATPDDSDSPSDAALMLAGWREQGKAFLRRLNGSFSAVIWDARRRAATLVTDRFGNRPLYVAANGGRLRFSSRIKSLTADPTLSRDVNPRGVAQFFSFGHYLLDDTSLRAVRVLPAACCSTWDATAGEWRTDAYYSWDEAYSAPAATAAGWLDRIGDAFAASVERQTAGTANLGLSLSGGLDARTILACIDHARTPVQTVCSGVQGSLDHRCARRLAGMVGCRHFNHVLDTRFLGEYLKHMLDNVRLTDGQYLSQCIIMPTLPLYRELGIEVLLRGHAGELMHMYKAYNYSLDAASLGIAGAPQLESWLFGRLRAYMVEGVARPFLAPHLWNDLEGLARDSLHADVEAATAAGPPAQRIWRLFVSQRLRRETVLSMNEFRSVVETRLPIQDNDLIALLLAAPVDLKLGEEIQSALLRRFRPEFLRVVNANTATRVGAGPWRRRLSTLALRVAAKLGLPGFLPYERLGIWLRCELRSVVETVLLDPRTLDRGLYDADGVRDLVDNHGEQGRNHTYAILALMIFELGQRYLHDEAPTQADQRSPAIALRAGR